VKRLFRVVFLVAIVAGFTVGMYYLFLEVFGLDVLERGSVENIDLGADGLLLVGAFVGLYVFQSITMNLIPGTTTFFISVLAYTLFGADIIVLFLVSCIAVLASSIALYFLGRFGGRKVLYWLFDKETLDRRLEWFSQNGAKGVPWLFLVPLFPTDLLCLTCGVAKMKFWHFLLIVFVFRPIEIALLLSYPFILQSDYVQSMPVWGRVLAINMIIVNMILLVVYYRVLLRIFRGDKASYAKRTGSENNYAETIDTKDADLV